MRSIEDTLASVLDIVQSLPVDIDIALIGGYAAVLHGVERTTLDVDFCVYSSMIAPSHDPREFYNRLSEVLPKRFEARLIRGSSIHGDPFKHDVIFIEDTAGEFLRIDFLMAKYKWELEAIRSARRIEGIPIPVITKPYLAALKLRASSYKDSSDVVNLMSLMTDDEKETTFALAKRIGRDRKLETILTPPMEEAGEEMPEELL